MEGNKGIPACPKYPFLPDLGLAGKPVTSELLYKLVPSTNIIEKNRFFTLFCGIKIITYKIGIEKEHYLLQNVSCLKLRTEVE